MSQTLRWGILGTGNIAKQFAAGVRQSARCRTVAVASRTIDTARDFAQSYEITSAYGSYEAMLADKSVDAVYLSLPNSLHREWTIRSIRAGKHVLCEKPFAMNADETAEMIDVAQREGRVLIEAFMYRAHPQTHAIVAAVRAGKIGQLQVVRTSFCYRTTRIAGNVRFVREQGGGALMDVGCYCLSFARLLAGEEPSAVHAVAKFHQETGVDEITTGVLGFPGGTSATFACGMSVQADNGLMICGTDGYITVEWPWKPQPGKGAFTIARGVPPRQDLSVPKADGVAKTQATAAPASETIRADADRDLYAVEADAFANAVLDDAPPFVSAEDTLGNMQLLDRIREQIGLRFD